VEETRDELDEDDAGHLDRGSTHVELLASALDALTASVARAVHEVAGSEALPSGWGPERGGGSPPSADVNDEWLAAMIRSVDQLARDPVTQTNTQGRLASGL
jgi:hypothetical protein